MSDPRAERGDELAGLAGADAPGQSARRCGWGSCSSAGTPTRSQHERALTEGIVLAAEHGAQLVCLQELTLSPYFAITPDGAEAARGRARAARGRSDDNVRAQRRGRLRRLCARVPVRAGRPR